MTKLTDAQRRLADLLFDVGAIKFGEFKLKLHQSNPDAPLSPIYLNLRTARHPKNPGPLTDEIMEIVGELFGELLDQLTVFTYFADIPDAGEPFGDQVAAALETEPDLGTEIRRLRLTKITREDGSRYITNEVKFFDSEEGDIEVDEICLVVDELITHADSKLEAIRTLENVGLTVRDVLVLVDRDQGGKAQLQAAGYRLLAALTLTDLLDYYAETERISYDTANKVANYLADNQAA